jgi:hypothetical protein
MTPEQRLVAALASSRPPQSDVIFALETMGRIEELRWRQAAGSAFARVVLGAIGSACVALWVIPFYSVVETTCVLLAGCAAIVMAARSFGGRMNIA